MRAGTAISASTARKNPLSPSTPSAGVKPLRNGAPQAGAPRNTAAPAAPIKVIPAACTARPSRQRPRSMASTPPPATTPAPAAVISSAALIDRDSKTQRTHLVEYYKFQRDYEMVT